MLQILSPQERRIPGLNSRFEPMGHLFSIDANGVFLVVNKIDFATYHALTESANGILANLTTSEPSLDECYVSHPFHGEAVKRMGHGEL
jgi:hypothetical protein